MKLHRDRRYGVTRVYDDTKNCAAGDSFNIIWCDNRWSIFEDGEVIYSAHECTFQNTKYWIINYCLDEDDLQGEYEKEYKAMSFDKVKTEALEIELDVAMVNGARIDTFSDADLINIIKAERDKREVLFTDLGANSKYVQAKVTLMDVNIQILIDELDSRV